MLLSEQNIKSGMIIWISEKHFKFTVWCSSNQALLTPSHVTNGHAVWAAYMLQKRRL